MFLEGFKRVRNRLLMRLDMTFRPHGRPKKQHNGSCAGWPGWLPTQASGKEVTSPPPSPLRTAGREKGSSLNSASLAPRPPALSVYVHVLKAPSFLKRSISVRQFRGHNTY